MEQEQVHSEHGGIGFFELLAVLFISSKLVGHVDWTWWVVLSPAWGGVLFYAVVLGVLGWLMARAERRLRSKWPEARKRW